MVDRRKHRVFRDIQGKADGPKPSNIIIQVLLENLTVGNGIHTKTQFYVINEYKKFSMQKNRGDGKKRRDSTVPCRMSGDGVKADNERRTKT